MRGGQDRREERGDKREERGARREERRKDIGERREDGGTREQERGDKREETGARRHYRKGEGVEKAVGNKGMLERANEGAGEGRTATRQETKTSGQKVRYRFRTPKWCTPVPRTVSHDSKQ